MRPRHLVALATTRRRTRRQPVDALVASFDALGPSSRAKVLEALVARRDGLAAEAAEAGPVSWNLARERVRQLLATLPDR